MPLELLCRSGHIIPMAANLLFILYHCPASPPPLPSHHTHLVLALHNERPIMLPACKGQLYCPLDTLVAEVEGPHAADACGFEQACGLRARQEAVGASAGRLRPHTLVA
jgi:multiple inositol-polyphosphate phosphatase/2,3-bisphosphoglycerate 3-phosphatase